MSTPNEQAPAYDAAEKGTLEIAAPAAVFTLSSKDEKKMFDEKHTTIQGWEKMSAPKGGKKKKVSKWILWKLWFNTYR